MTVSQMVPALTRRRVVAADRAFVLGLVRAERRAALTASGLPAAALAHLVDVQVRAWLAGPGGSGEQHLFEVAGVPVAHLVLAHGPSTRVVWIAVAAEHRRRGVAGAVLRTVLDEASTADRAVDLHVDPANTAAVALYHSLGLRPVGTTGADLHLSTREPS